MILMHIAGTDFVFDDACELCSVFTGIGTIISFVAFIILCILVSKGKTIEQCIEIDYNSEDTIIASDIFAVYSKWAKQNNEYEMSSKKFFLEAQKKLPEKGRSGKGIYYAKIHFTEYAQQFITRNYRIDDFH